MANANFENSLKVLILIGAVDEDRKVTSILTSIKCGLQKWSRGLDKDLISSLDECVNKFSDEYEVSSQSEALAPHTKLTCVKNNVSLVVLVSPTCVMVNNSIAQLMLCQCYKRLVVYGGHFVDAQPNWVFQDGVYAIEDLEYLLIDKEIASAFVRTSFSSKITISCCEASKWKVVKQDTPQVEIEFIDPFLSSDENTPTAVLEHVDKFIDFLEDALKKQVQGIFSQLSPPKHKSFLRTQRPSIYIFPAGNGDSAFFKVDCFNVLINGGALTRPWFWHLVRHEYRIDCVIATHLSTDNLPGLNSFFLRKLHEQKLKFPKDQECEEFQYLSKFLLSPDLGTVFINPPTKFLENSLRKSSDTSAMEPTAGGDWSVSKQLDVRTADVVRETFRLLKGLQIEPQPLTRRGAPEPITLLYKLGVGKLQLFPISPDEDSKELDYVRQKWGNSIKATGKSGVKLPSGEEGHSVVSDLASMCCLLVWFPASPKERIIRVLFPGNAPESRIFDGMERLKSCKFLTNPAPTALNMESNKTNLSRPSRTSTVKAKSAAASKPIRSSMAAARPASTQNSRATASAKTAATNGAASKQTAAKSTVKSATSSKPVPLLGKISTQKKPTLGAYKKPPTAKVDAANRNKREGDAAKPNEKRSKADKLIPAKAQLTKAKSPSASIKDDIKAKSKSATEKVAKTSSDAKRVGAKPQTKSADAVSPKTKKATSSPAKSPINTRTKVVTSSPGEGTETARNANDALQPPTPAKSVNAVPQKLGLDEPEDRDATEHLKTRPSPEGQDHVEQEEFVESALEEVPESPKSVKDQEKEESTNSASDLFPSSDYLTVSQKTSDDYVEASMIANVDLTVDDNPEKEKAETASLEGGSEAAKQAATEDMKTISKEDAVALLPLAESGQRDDDMEDGTFIVPELEKKSAENEQETRREDEPSPCPAPDLSNDNEAVSLSNFRDLNVDEIRLEELPSDVHENATNSPPEEINVDVIVHDDEAQGPCDNETTEKRSFEAEPVQGFRDNEIDLIKQDAPVAREEIFGQPQMEESTEAVQTAQNRSNDVKAVDDHRNEQRDHELENLSRVGLEESSKNSDQSNMATALSDASQTCEAETISDSEQRYLEIEDSFAKKEAQMSCTSLSSGPCLSIENHVEEIESCQDPPASSGIVEFHSDNQDSLQSFQPDIPKDVQDLVEPCQQMRRVDARVDDADFAACDENEKPSPDGMQQLKIDGDVSCDHFDNLYDDNGNRRTSSAYKSEFIADQSRVDAILQWPQTPCEDSCDVDTAPIVPSSNSMIISFQEVSPAHEESKGEDALNTGFSSRAAATDFSEGSAGPSEEVLVHSFGGALSDHSGEVLENLSPESPADRQEKAFPDLSKESLADGGILVDPPADDVSFHHTQDGCDLSQTVNVGDLTEENIKQEPCVSVDAHEKNTRVDVSSSNVTMDFDPSDARDAGVDNQQSSEQQPDMDKSCCFDTVFPDRSNESADQNTVASLTLSSHPDAPSGDVNEKPSNPQHLLDDKDLLDHDDYKDDKDVSDAGVDDKKEDFAVSRSNDVTISYVTSSDNEEVMTKNVVDNVKSYDIDNINYRLVHDTSAQKSMAEGDLSSSAAPSDPSQVKNDSSLSSGIALACSEFDHDLGQLHADQIVSSKSEGFDSLSFCNPLVSAGEESCENRTSETSENATAFAQEDCLKSSGFTDQGILLDSKVLEAKREVPSTTVAQAKKSPDDLLFPQSETNPASSDSPIRVDPNNPFMTDMLPRSSTEESCPAPRREDDPAMAPERASSSKPKKPTQATNGLKKDPPYFHVDLAYVPHHANKNHCGVEFFKRIRSHYYVLSGFDASHHEPSSEALEALLEGKKTWGKSSDPDQSNVSVIPTHNSTALYNWYEKNHKDLNAEGIHLVAIGSKVQMHSEEIEACKIEL